MDAAAPGALRTAVPAREPGALRRARARGRSGGSGDTVARRVRAAGHTASERAPVRREPSAPEPGHLAPRQPRRSAPGRADRLARSRRSAASSGRAPSVTRSAAARSSSRRRTTRSSKDTPTASSSCSRACSPSTGRWTSTSGPSSRARSYEAGRSRPAQGLARAASRSRPPRHARRLSARDRAARRAWSPGYASSKPRVALVDEAGLPQTDHARRPDGSTSTRRSGASARTSSSSGCPATRPRASSGTARWWRPSPSLGPSSPTCAACSRARVAGADEHGDDRLARARSRSRRSSTR